MQLIIVYPDMNRKLTVRVDEGTTIEGLANTLVDRLKLPRLDPDKLRELKYSLLLQEKDGNESPLNQEHKIGSEVLDGDIVLLRSIGIESSMSKSEFALATYRVGSRWSVRELEHFLKSLRDSYVTLFVQNEIIKDAKKTEHRYYEDSLKKRHDHIASNISSDEDLIINKIFINSPGVIEVIGSLNPLETIRQYLNDRRQAEIESRKEKREEEKDSSHRNAIEQAKAVLEIESLKTNVARERALLLRDVGFPQEEIRPYITELLEKPLEQLVVYQSGNNFDCVGVESLGMQKIEIIEDKDNSDSKSNLGQHLLGNS